MPNFTEHYKFAKPLRSEFYSIDLFNENIDKIEEILLTTGDVAEELNRKIENLENNLKGGLGESGYCVLPNGMIFQWGNTVIQSHGDTVYFPTSFTNKSSISIVLSSGDAIAFDGSVSTTDTYKDITHFLVKWNSSVSPIRIMWHALGY